MREFLSTVFVLAGFAAFSFAEPSRRPAALRALPLARPVFTALGFAGFAASAFALWPEGAAYASLFTCTVGCVVATLFTLVAPVLLRGTASSSPAPARVRKKPLFTLHAQTLARVVAALAGTMPGAVLLGLALSLRLPLTLESRLALGVGSMALVWLTAVCLVWLSRSGARAFAWCLAFAAVGGVLVGTTP
jgi:hypothetical protein